MTRPDPLLFALQRLSSDLALIDRNHHHIRHERAEDDVDHSFTVTLLCWYIHSRYKVNLNLEKILKYAVAHDFVERYAGDTNTFASSEARLKKIEAEKTSLEKLASEFKDFGDLVEIMRAYEAKQDEEALFVWTVDKMQALILGDLDDWRPYKKAGVTYGALTKKHRELLKACSPYCREIYEALLAYCKMTYYDNPRAVRASAS